MINARELGMIALRHLVRRRFPKVRQLSTAELAAQLADPARPTPVLFDVRKPHEFAVSHLPEARNVDPDSAAEALLPTLPSDRPVVLYCSVGYRSSQLATRLIDAGFRNVSNLDGSIFQWANEGRPLVQGDRATRGQTSHGHNSSPADEFVATHRVHPYSAIWSWLVRPGARAPIRGSA